jgi:outer membrane lipoprotein-sorting protein
MSIKSRPAALAVLATALLMTSAFAGGVAADSPSPAAADRTDTPDGDEIIDAFVERISSLETAQYTQTSETTYNNQTYSQTIRVAADLEDFQKRTETVSTTVGSNTTTVMNETAAVTYNEDENTVSEYNITGQMVLPRIEVLANQSQIEYDYRGTATVEGQDTHVLVGSPVQQSPSNSDVQSSVTIYVHAETSFPVQIETETNTENGEFKSTVTFDNVTLDEPIPDSTFDIDVPDDATDPTTTTEYSSYESYSNLAANTNLSIPGAEVPGDFDFDHGTIVDSENYNSVGLSYTDGDQIVTVNTRASTLSDFDYSDSNRYESVDLGDTTGYLYSHEDFTSLHWETDQTYYLYGQVSNETAVTIAQAITDA